VDPPTCLFITTAKIMAMDRLEKNRPSQFFEKGEVTPKIIQAD
jgi:hypothetical protein